jgi:hypothetical protein
MTPEYHDISVSLLDPKGLSHFHLSVLAQLITGIIIADEEQKVRYWLTTRKDNVHRVVLIPSSEIHNDQEEQEFISVYPFKTVDEFKAALVKASKDNKAFDSLKVTLESVFAQALLTEHANTETDQAEEASVPEKPAVLKNSLTLINDYLRQLVMNSNEISGVNVPQITMALMECGFHLFIKVAANYGFNITLKHGMQNREGTILSLQEEIVDIATHVHLRNTQRRTSENTDDSQDKTPLFLVTHGASLIQVEAAAIPIYDYLRENGENFFEIGLKPF